MERANGTDEVHRWLITGNKPPFEFGQPSTLAIADVIGDPTAVRDNANTITFTARDAGSYS